MYVKMAGELDMATFWRSVQELWEILPHPFRKREVKECLNTPLLQKAEANYITQTPGARGEGQQNIDHLQVGEAQGT